MAPSASAQFVIIGGAGITTNGTGADPVCDYFNYIRYQTVYLASELTLAGMPSGATITALGWSVSEDNGPAFPSYTVRLGHTAATNAAAHIADPLTTVFGPASVDWVVQSAGSHQMVTFSSSFVWDGVSNIVVDICHNNSMPYASTYGGVRAASLTSGARAIRADGGSSLCGSATTSTLANRPQVRFNYTGSPCAGDPNPGNTVASANPVCSGAPLTLSLQNATTGSGVSYQWYVSTVSAGGPWTPVGTNSATFATTQTVQSWYYCNVTCSTGPDDEDSNPVQVDMDILANCYCTPTYTFGKTDGDLISNAVIVGTTLANNTGTSPTNPAYTYFNTLPNHTANLQAGTSYQIQVTVGTFGSQNVAVWIDFNENGLFETPNERVGFTTTSIGSGGTGTFTLSLPCNPTPGVKRMRIRDVWNTAGNLIDPCINYGYGETEDYDVTIDPPPACPSPSSLVASSPTANSVTLNWNIGCTETAWEVEYGAPGFALGTGTVVPAGTNVAFVLGGLASTTAYEAYVRADCGVDGVSGSLGPVSFTTLAPPPANDDCANATPLTVGYSCNPLSTNNTAATQSIAPLTCNTFTSSSALDVWFSFVATGSANRVTVSGGPGFDAIIDVRSGACNGTNIGCADATVGGQVEVVSLTGLSEGDTYYVRVYGWAGGVGNFSICVQQPDCEGNYDGPVLPGTACDDGDSQTAIDYIDGNCVCEGVACTTDLDFVYQADGYDNLTWVIYEQGTNLIAKSGGGALLGNGSEATCLPDGCFYLVVTDAGGDGIIGGGYLLKINSSVRLIDNLYGTFGEGGFTSGGTSTIDNNEGFCLPVGTDRLIVTSCDKADWKITPCGGEFVVANANAAVSAQYNVNNANSGYQMWWYTPNGGYSFKRFQSHSTNNGLAASATRACHFMLNGWSGNQLVEGGFYNVKVRGRVNGVYNPWGPACRLTVNSAEAQCPRTKLMDLPNNQYLSCGQSRTIGANQYVHAKPVSRLTNSCNTQRANRYQFRFRIPAEFVTIVKTAPVGSGNYFVNTLGLTCGKTYEVDVRVSFDGGSTWCHSSDPYGDICLLTTTCSFGMAEEGTSGTATEARVAMYPNPNRGDQLFVSLNDLEEGVSAVNVDIYDAFGKRVAQRTIGVQDGFVNTTIALNGELANGMYMVSITAGTNTFNERLVIQK